jgi:hypothetical protein
MAYCADGDLLLQADFPLPAGLTKAQYVNEAADEINMRIAKRYKIPVAFTSADDQNRYSSTITLLKTLNAHIATGRLVMAMSIKAERPQLHSYGNNLVKDALKIVDDICYGEINLEGAVLSLEVTDETTGFGSQRPMVLNLDDESGVEAFYNIVTAPPTLLDYYAATHWSSN